MYLTLSSQYKRSAGRNLGDTCHSSSIFVSLCHGYFVCACARFPKRHSYHDQESIWKEGSRKLKSRVYAAFNMVVNSIKKMNKWNKKKRNHPMDLANKLVLSVGILKTNNGYARAARTCTYFRVTLCNTTTWIKMSPRQCFHVKHFFLFGEKRYVNAALKYFYLLLKNHLLGHSIVTSACLCWVEMYAQKKTHSFEMLLSLFNSLSVCDHYNDVKKGKFR